MRYIYSISKLYKIYRKFFYITQIIVLIIAGNGIIQAPVLASLQSSNAVGLSIKNVAERCKRINLNKLHRFQEAGLENDELLETTEELVNLFECYEDSDTF